MIRVETKMHFSIIAKMPKSYENGTIFGEFSFRENFVFAKIFAKILRKFREIEKSIKFDSDMTCMVHVV
jgi:hypothetical protein